MPIPTSLGAIIRAFDVRAQEEVYTALPAVVEKYDPTLNQVDLKIAVKDVRRSEDGSPVYFEFPIIPNVPVNLPRGGGMIISLPLQAGDSGLLVVSTLEVGGWELSGEAPAEPLNVSRQSLSSCTFVPGWFPITKPPSATDLAARSTKMIVGKDGGTQIQIDDTVINLGGDPTAAPLALHGALGALNTAIQAPAVTDIGTLKAAVATWATGLAAFATTKVTAK